MPQTPTGPGPQAAMGELADLPADLGAVFDHVAIAGRRIRDLLPLWRDTLGGRFATGADNPAVGWRVAGRCAEVAASQALVALREASGSAGCGGGLGCRAAARRAAASGAGAGGGSRGWLGDAEGG